MNLETGIVASLEFQDVACHWCTNSVDFSPLVRIGGRRDKDGEMGSLERCIASRDEINSPRSHVEVNVVVSLENVSMVQVSTRSHLSGRPGS